MSTTLPPLKIEVRPSRIVSGEVGLFTVRDIAKDDLVIEADAFDESPTPWSVYEALDPLTQEKIRGFCSATEEVFYAPEDFNRLPINWYMNHSCEPNVGFDDAGNFVAMRDIKANEELSWDYSFNETNPKFSMDCLCGSATCRKIVTGSDWKILVLDEKKYPYIAKDIRELAGNDQPS